MLTRLWRRTARRAVAAAEQMPEPEPEQDHDRNLEDVLRECNIPEIYWAKIKGVFERGGPGFSDERSWPILLKSIDGHFDLPPNGGGIWESVELRVDQEVKVWSETAQGWALGHVTEVLDNGTKVKVEYMVQIDDVTIKRREATKSIDDNGLLWKFRGDLGTLQ